MRLRRSAIAVAAVTMITASACGGDSGPPVLNWYINPDNGGQEELAKKCTDEAGGAYEIEASILPNNASQQREQLIRRLAANDSSIDLMSLDPPFVPEFAEAGFLLDIPDDRAEEFTDGVVESAITGATWKDELVGIPFWANTQLLWFRRSVAEQAGLDLESGPVTWEQIIDAAEQTGTTVGVQANRYEGYTVWINALIEGTGTSVLLNPEAPVEDIELGLNEPGAEEGAAVIADLVAADVAGPAVSTAMEEEARALFQSDAGGFMVNWPYVWQAANGEVESGALDSSFIDDLGWTVYPQTVEGEESAPPFGGITLGIGAFTQYPDEALEAAACITSPESRTEYMLFSGNPSASEESYSDPEVVEAFPMAPVILESLQNAKSRPQTPFYSEVSESLQRTYHPPSSVQPDSTPDEAAELIVGVLNKEVLL
ncbi:MAG TPA: extracellular solute-binding protein [Jiangellaceae bacterium]|nr:extracellular solute-binding protein [Jiangellaceae bacterium]